MCALEVFIHDYMPFVPIGVSQMHFAWCLQSAAMLATFWLDAVQLAAALITALLDHPEVRTSVGNAAC
jgi:hypothetical protein